MIWPFTVYRLPLAVYRLPFTVYRYQLHATSYQLESTDEKPHDTLGRAEGDERLGRSDRMCRMRCASATEPSPPPSNAEGGPRGPGMVASVTSPKCRGNNKLERYEW